MSVRNYPGAPTNGTYVRGSGLSGASTGDKLTYTCPANTQAVVTGIWVNPTAGAATIRIRPTLNGVLPSIMSGTTAFALQGQLTLNAGDVVAVNVAVLDAASVFDAVIAVLEFPAT
jgi:hypothetical protein